MDFSQLAKVRHVFEHYGEHLAETGDPFSFFDFFWAHFIEPAAHDSQHPPSDHQELPFQSIGSPSIFAVSPSDLHLGKHTIDLPDNRAFHYAGLLMNDIPHFFFHPPAAA